MDALNSEQWVVAGKVIDEFGSKLDRIFNDGTYVDTTATGFLMHFTDAVVKALQEDEAWNAHAEQLNSDMADYVDMHESELGADAVELFRMITRD